MSEESTRRLENAMAKLAEISAQHNDWLAAHEERLAAHEESLADHKERLAAIEQTNQGLERTLQEVRQTNLGLERTLQEVKQTNRTLSELAVDHQQLLANMQRRVTGLEEVNATLVGLLQHHNDGITEMRAAQANADAKIALLAESQAHTDRRLDALIDIVRGRLNGQSGNSS